jgi:hypothetical protein
MNPRHRVAILLVEDEEPVHLMLDGVFSRSPYYGAFCFVDVSGDPPLAELLDEVGRQLLDLLTHADGRPVVHAVVLGSHITEREKTVAFMRECDRMQDRFPALGEHRRRLGEAAVSADCLSFDFIDADGGRYNNHCSLPAAQLTDGYDYEPWAEIPEPHSAYDEIVRGNPVLRLQARAIQPDVIAAAREHLTHLAREQLPEES